MADVAGAAGVTGNRCERVVDSIWLPPRPDAEKATAVGEPAKPDLKRRIRGGRR
jgi:hypothetical protein